MSQLWLNSKLFRFSFLITPARRRLVAANSQHRPELFWSVGPQSSRRVEKLRSMDMATAWLSASFDTSDSAMAFWRTALKGCAAKRLAFSSMNSRVTAVPAADSEPVARGEVRAVFAICFLRCSARVWKRWAPGSRGRSAASLGAPVMAVVCMDKALSSYLVFGLFIQTVCIAAQGYGVDSFIASAFTSQQDILRKELDIPEDLRIVTGIGLGYRNPEAIINPYRSPRMA
jgi:nitroreductase